jgi:hypothetical protein
MTMIAGKPFTQLLNLNLLDELRIQGVLVNFNTGDTYVPRYFTSAISSIDYIAIAGDWVEARNGITVYLPFDAEENDEVIVANGDGSTITIDANGNSIKYTTTDTSMTTSNQGTSLHFQLFVDGSNSYWRIR